MAGWPDCKIFASGEQLIFSNGADAIVCASAGNHAQGVAFSCNKLNIQGYLHRGLKHYFIVRFPQRAGALRSFITDVMGPKDDITHFSYTKKTSKDRGPVVIGIELAQSGDLESLERKMTENGFAYEYLNDKPLLFEFLV